MRSRDLRLRILAIVGASCLVGGGAVACSNHVVVDEAGTGGTSSGDGAGGSGVSSTSVAASSSATTTGTGAGGTGTTGAATTGAGGNDAGPPSELACAPEQTTTNPPNPFEPPDQCFTAAELAPYIAGGPLPDVGASCDGGVLCPTAQSLLPYEPSCYTYFVGPPYSVNGECCYAFSCGCCGRPFMIEGTARQAAPARRPDWAEPAPSDTALPPAVARELCDAWLADALLEHASIASFSRFALHLLALGAPPDLVTATHRAALDEIVHAEACFALASRFAGEALGPGPLPLDGAIGSVTLSEAAAAAVVEGCVGETIAAFVAAEQLAVAGDPAVRAALTRIAEDEARHAELAWRFVRWALAQQPTVARAVAEAFARAADAFEASATADARSASFVDGATAEHHGRLPPATLAAAKRLALAEVIAPCAKALLREAASA
jgi:hypothetical protein